MTTKTTTPRAFRRGVQACRDGQCRFMNPFSDLEAEQWFEGWDEEQEYQLARIGYGYN